jgi:hypothetical protein
MVSRLLSAGLFLSLMFGISLAQPKSDPPQSQSANWKSLWDGKTLKGWHVIGSGEWKIQDGAIVGTHPASSLTYGHLVTDASYRDLDFRCKFKALRGNSGLYFRLAETGFSGVSGFQVEIDPKQDTGGLYETNGRAWVVQPNPNDVVKWFKANEWNDLLLSAHAGDITVHINGIQTAQLHDDPGKWKQGPFALQMHMGQDVDVMFKDLEIRETTAAADKPR